MGKEGKNYNCNLIFKESVRGKMMTSHSAKRRRFWLAHLTFKRKKKNNRRVTKKSDTSSVINSSLCNCSSVFFLISRKKRVVNILVMTCREGNKRLWIERGGGGSVGDEARERVVRRRPGISSYRKPLIK